jgi:anti-anti-sigma factor
MAFALSSRTDGDAAVLTLKGELDASAAPELRKRVEHFASDDSISRLVLELDELTYMASAGLRALVFAKQKLGTDVDLYLVGTRDTVAETIELTGFHHSVTMVDTYDDIPRNAP